MKVDQAFSEGFILLAYKTKMEREDCLVFHVIYREDQLGVVLDQIVRNYHHNHSQVNK